MNLLLWNNQEKVRLTPHGNRLVVALMIYNLLWTLIIGATAIAVTSTNWINAFNPLALRLWLAIYCGWMTVWSVFLFTHIVLYCTAKHHQITTVRTSWTIFFTIGLLISLNPVNLISGFYCWRYYHRWVNPQIIEHGGLYDKPPHLYYY